MKKIILIISIIVFFCFFIKDLNNNEEQIRIRIIANSDSGNDQNIKKEVIKFLYTNYNFEFNSQQECEIYINNNLESIKKELQYFGNVKVTFQNHIFNNKTYNDKVREPEEYKTLLIEIDNAEGENFWGILFSNTLIENENTIKYKSYILDLFKENN